MFSIIIPAYNEEKVLTKTISHILADNALEAIELIVVLNGCEDSSLTILESFIEQNQQMLDSKRVIINIVDTETASKTNAINIGLTKAKHESVVLLDADIVISGHSIMQLMQSLMASEFLAVSPSITFECASASVLLKKYYQVEQASYYNHHLRLSNVIGLNKQGIERIGKLPEIVADDEYIRRKLPVNSYKVLNDVNHVFKAPKTFTTLLSVLTRVERGNFQLKRMSLHSEDFPLLDHERRVPKSSLLCFYGIKLYAKLVARVQYWLKIDKWHRDETTRT